MYGEYPQGIRTWQWVVTLIVIVILVVLGLFLFRGGGMPRQTEAEYCKELGNSFSMRNLPAKCIKYFLNPDERAIYQSVVHE